MKEPTNRQREMLEHIYQYISLRGLSPTIRELADAMGIKSTNGVNDHLKHLARKGFIERTERSARSLRITPLGRELLGIQMTDALGALVLRGTGVIEHNQEGEHSLTLAVTDQTYDTLGGLVDTGLFGTSRADVAKHLLYEKLREILNKNRKAL